MDLYKVKDSPAYVVSFSVSQGLHSETYVFKKKILLSGSNLDHKNQTLKVEKPELSCVLGWPRGYISLLQTQNPSDAKIW